MKEITWRKMHQLEGTDISPFGIKFDLLNPVTDNAEICFGLFRVQGFNYYRDGKLQSVKIYADGEYHNVVSSDTVLANIID